MQTSTPTPPKPVNEAIRAELVALPELTPRRLKYRERASKISRFVINILTRPQVVGLENFPQTGPGVIVANHLGDADAVLGLAYLPIPVDGIGKIELHDLPIIGKMLDAYGVIWVHRGQPDRRALKSAIQGLQAGRFIGIAPEGRQSVTGALEEGTGGAAYLALKADAPVIPVTFVGTEDSNVYGSWLRLRRGRVSMTIGEPFALEKLDSFKESIQAGTEKIMRRLAKQLPEAYQGAYHAS